MSDNARAYFYRGVGYLKQGQLDPAAADFSQSIALRPGFAEAYHNRAGAWLWKKDYDRAWEDVRRCREAGGTPLPTLLEPLRKESGRQQ